MISIIIPTLNEEKIIEKTLKSLREFKGDYEIIVSDGKSTDRTVEIARRYTDKVTVYEGTTRQTIAMGRNLGASIAKGDYLVFLDADVEIPDINNFFTKALSLFKNDSQLVGLTVFVKVFPEVSTLSDRFFFGIINFANYFLNNILNSGSAIGEFQMIPSDIFKKINGYNEKIVVGEDAMMFEELSKIGKVRTEATLHVLHTSRRAHSVTWSSLLFFFVKNRIYLSLFNRSSVDEWEPIR